MAVQKALLFTEQPLNLILGDQLENIEVAYQTYGKIKFD